MPHFWLALDPNPWLMGATMDMGPVGHRLVGIASPILMYTLTCGIKPKGHEIWNILRAATGPVIVSSRIDYL